MPKKEIPAMLIPADAIHTGDGWCWQRRQDGSVRVTVIEPVAATFKVHDLSKEEWFSVQKHLGLNEAVEIPSTEA
jgi:hypothetical protein